MVSVVQEDETRIAGGGIDERLGPDSSRPSADRVAFRESHHNQLYPAAALVTDG